MSFCLSDGTNATERISSKRQLSLKCAKAPASQQGSAPRLAATAAVCKGFGHVTKACPEGLLPLLTELDKKTNAANPPAESSKRDAEGVKGLSDKGDATNVPQEDNPTKTLADGKRPPPLKKGNPPKANVPQSTRKEGTSYNNKCKSAAKVGKDQKSKGGLSESSKKKTKKKMKLNSIEDERLDDLYDNPDYDTNFFKYHHCKAKIMDKFSYKEEIKK